MNNRNIPTSPRGQNTVATKLKKLQAFFNELESNDEYQYHHSVNLENSVKQ